MVNLEGDSLVAYGAAVQKLVKSFSSIQFNHVPRAHNKHVDDFAPLVQKIDNRDEVVDVRVIKNTL